MVAKQKKTDSKSKSPSNEIAYDIKGKSIKDLQSIDIHTFKDLSRSSLSKIVSKLASAANKRLRNFQKAGESSPAYRAAMESGGLFSVKNLDKRGLQEEYIRVTQFLSRKTSTLADWRKSKRRMSKELKKFGINIPMEKIEETFTLYEKLKEVSPEISNRQLKYMVLDKISDYIEENHDFDSILDNMVGNINELYEENQRLINAFDGVSSFFE